MQACAFSLTCLSLMVCAHPLLNLSGSIHRGLVGKPLEIRSNFEVWLRSYRGRDIDARDVLRKEASSAQHHALYILLNARKYKNNNNTNNRFWGRGCIKCRKENRFKNRRVCVLCGREKNRYIYISIDELCNVFSYSIILVIIANFSAVTLIPIFQRESYFFFQDN